MNRWNPVREMITLREAMDQLFNENMSRNQHFSGQQQPVWQLPLDAYATEDAIVLIADVPGLKPEDLDITLEGDTLTVRGEFKKRADDKQYLLRELPTGRFERVMTINTPIDNHKVEADFQDGVLTLTLPKAETVKPKQIKVKASNGQGQLETQANQ
jgi:HSP20 family protein